MIVQVQCSNSMLASKCRNGQRRIAIGKPRLRRGPDTKRRGKQADLHRLQGARSLHQQRKITINPRTIAFFILSMLIVHRLAAQTLQLSFNARAIVQGRSAGVEARIGTNHDVWNFDGCLSVQFVKAVV